jgi:hypothetical protein
MESNESRLNVKIQRELFVRPYVKQRKRNNKKIKLDIKIA